MKKALSVIALLSVIIASSQEKIDYKAVEKIRKEGLENSKIEKIAFELTDKSGPRLTNSKGYERAANYAIQQLRDWGLTNVRKDVWGEFGRGWEIEKSYIAMTKPYYMPLIGIPKAWSYSTEGLIKAKVYFLDIDSKKDLDKYSGKLKGGIIGKIGDSNQGPTFKPDATRYSKEALEQLSKPRTKEDIAKSDASFQKRVKEWRQRVKINRMIDSLLRKEKSALILQSQSGRHGTFRTGFSGGYRKNAKKSIPEMDMMPEHVNLMKRLFESGVEVEIEAEIKTRFLDDNLNGYNVIAEIEGHDPVLKSEVVMLGAHLDSWHGATGATDNASGCAVMMEAVRIIIASGLKPKRTIRIALWDGEEQAHYGSRNYIKNNFGNLEGEDELKPDHGKVSAYYNIDNGTGRIRGIYLQGNEKVRPVFSKWFEPFEDIIDNTTLTIRDTGGTDHWGFDEAGIPGFQFIQDRIEYSSRTHHSNADYYERLVMDDLKQMATIIASFVYHTAQRDKLLPRKEIKKKK